jgi:hypothetical protein
MPRGRPPKIKVSDDTKYIKISTKGGKIPKKNKSTKKNNWDNWSETDISDLDDLSDNANLANLPRQKRKYTKRQKIEPKIGDDNMVIKPEAKKRGRKRGRKKRDQELLFKTEEVLDYMIRNYPQMGINQIRSKVIDGMISMKQLGDTPYVLEKFTHTNGSIYYIDTKGAIFNTDAIIVGYFVKQTDGKEKMYLIEQKNIISESYDEIINSIENKKPIK